MKVLLVAYHYPPATGVATKRPSYWHEKLVESGIDSYVLTATKQELITDRIIFLNPDNKRSLLIKDEGIRWVDPLSLFFKNNNIKFDIILFTGGPFMHFSVIKRVRKYLPKVKIILDFRDPFAINPRFNNSRLKVAVKRFYEDRFILSSDFVITVNDYCVKLLRLKGSNYAVINNGFDERVLDKIEPIAGFKNIHSRINFVYAGRFAKDRDPSLFLNTLINYEDKASFHYVGDNLNEVDVDSKHVVDHKMQPYSGTISILKSCDIGLIFTSGSPFESTTKIFDYMACGLDILILSPTGIPSGSLHDITKKYGRVFWIKNDKESIASYLNNISSNMKDSVFDFDSFQYSRKAGFLKLLEILNTL